MEISVKPDPGEEMGGSEGVDIDLYADDIEQDFNTDEFGGDGVDLYDDVIANTGARGEGDGDHPISSTTDSHSNNNNNGPSKASSITSDRDGRERDGITPLRKHQAYVGGLTWWTSDQTIKDALGDIGVHDFLDVKFYENRANGQSKGYCVLTVGSDSSLRLIHEKLPKKEINGQLPTVTAPTKQALNQFEAQSKTRPSQGGGPPNNQPPNMNMMQGGPGPRGPPMGPMGPQMGGGMGGGYGHGPRMMMPMRGGPRGMPPGMPPRNMGPPNQQGPPPGYNGPQRPPMGPGPQNMSPQGPPQRPPMEPYFQGGPGPQGMGPRGGPGGPMNQPGMDPRGPPPRGGDWNRPQMNSYPHGPHGPSHQGPMPGPPNNRGPPSAPPMLPGPPPAPAPHMNPAFFNQGPGPQGPTPGGPPSGYGGPPTGPRSGPGYAPPMDHRDQPPAMSEAEFEEVMSRNRTVSSSAISRAVQDAATGEFASAIETLVTAISLIKQSKVCNDDRCKILVSSLQDTLHGIESKSYGRRVEDRSRSRDRERRSRHGGRRDRSRSREREYRERSRDRYYEYPRERSRSREREYRERTRVEEPNAPASSRYYDERDSRYQRGTERERRVEPDRTRERERDPEVHRATRH